VPSNRHQAEYDAQSRIISNLHQDIAEMRKKVARASDNARKYKRAHDFYMMIQKACMENPIVAEEFQRFLSVCRLVGEDEGTPGLTTQSEDFIDYQNTFEF
jgi:hypothetical protein